MPSRRRPTLLSRAIGLVTPAAGHCASAAGLHRRGRCPRTRHRDARRACPAPRVSTGCATPILTRRKAAGCTQGILGTFDSINPFVVKGLALAAGARLRGRESCSPAAMTSRSRSTACWPKTVDTDADRTYVKFGIFLDPAAKFSDGKPVTAAGRDSSPGSCPARQRPCRTTAPITATRSRSAEALRSRTVRFDLTGCRRPRAATPIPRADAGPRQARNQSRHLSRTPPSSRSLGSGPGVEQPRSTPAATSPSSEIRLLEGSQPSDQPRLSITSTRSAASISTATPIRISKPSRTASTTHASRARSEPLGDGSTTCRRCSDGRYRHESLPQRQLPQAELQSECSTPGARVFQDIRARKKRWSLLFDFDRLSTAASSSTISTQRSGERLVRGLGVAGSRKGSQRTRASRHQAEGPFRTRSRDDVMEGRWAATG